MKKTLKIFGAATVLVLGVLAIHYLQFRFDRSDVEHAVGAVRQTRPGGPGDSTLEQKISQKYGVAPDQVLWLSEIKSKTQGTVAVKAEIPGSDDDLSWEVDLVRFLVTPLSEPAKSLADYRQ